MTPVCFHRQKNTSRQVYSLERKNFPLVMEIRSFMS